MVTVLIGLVSGVISGMGIGGGAILIPALIMAYEIEQKTAQGINLVYFIPTAVIALVIHIKNKNVDVRNALIIGLTGIGGAILGSYIALGMNSTLLRKLFGGFLALIGIREIRKGFKN